MPPRALTGGGNSHHAAGHITHFGVNRISLLSLFYTLALLLTVGVADAWADQITVYVTGEIFIGTGDKAWDNSISTIRADIRKGYPEYFDCNGFNGVYNVEMTNTGYTYNGYPIYTYTLDQAGAQFRFKHYKNGVWQEDYTADWHGTTNQIYRGYYSSAHQWVSYGRDVTVYTIPDYLFKDYATPYNESNHYPAVCIQMGTGSTWNTVNMEKTSYTYDTYPIYKATILIDQNKFWEYQIKYFKKSDGTQVDLYQFNQYEPKTEYAPSYIDDKLYHGWNGSSHDFFAYTYDVALDPTDGTGGTATIKVTDGAVMPAATMPEKNGYAFGGYYTETEGNGDKYYNADGSGATNWNSRTITTLYAQWTENKHNVTVAVSPAGAGSVQVSGSPINSVEDIGYATHSPVMTAVPTNAAWVFKEWQVSSDDVQLDLLNYTYTTTGTTMEITATDDGQTLTAVFEPRFYLVGGEIVNAEDSEGTGTSSGMPGWANYNVPFQVVTNTPILATCSLTLGTNTNFYIMVRDRENGLSYGRASSTLGDDFPLVFEDQDNKVLFHSNGGTGYIFKITAIDGSGHPTVSVERPHRVNFGHRRVDIDGNAHNDNVGGSLAVTAGGATLSSGDWVTYNTNVQYDAATSLIPGYIRTWYTSDSYASTFDADGVWSHNLTSDDNVYVRFTEIPTSVTLANDGHGTVQIGGVDKTNTTCGVTTTRSLTAVPDDGYRFSSWTTSTTPDFDVDDAGNAEVTLIGHGAGTAGTLTANFSERWQLKAETGEWGSSTFTISNIAMVSGDIVGYVDISLAANTDYQFTIVDLQESATYKNGSDQVYYMTNGNSHNWSFAMGKTYNCGITTAGAGTYRFTWNITDKTLTVTYPNFVIYRSGDKAGDPRATEEDVESYAGGTIAKAIEFRMKVGALDRWYSLCLPFTVTAVKVWDDEDEAYYDLVPYYRTSVESTLNGGHYIIRTPSAATDLALADFDDWRDPTDPTGYLPSKNTPYIIQWHMTYFQDKYISFFGPAGQVIPASMTAGGAPSSDNVVNVCVNDAMTSGSKAGAYILEGDYGDGAWLRLEDASANRTIPPFECYILASSTTTAQYKVIHRRMTLIDTPTGWESVNTPSGGKAAKMLMDGQLYIIRGDNMYTIQGVLVK